MCNGWKPARRFLFLYRHCSSVWPSRRRRCWRLLGSTFVGLEPFNKLLVAFSKVAPHVFSRACHWTARSGCGDSESFRGFRVEFTGDREPVSNVVTRDRCRRLAVKDSQPRNSPHLLLKSPLILRRALGCANLLRGPRYFVSGAITRLPGR